jgi:hypothetical protein
LGGKDFSLPPFFSLNRQASRQGCEDRKSWFLDIGNGETSETIPPSGLKARDMTAQGNALGRAIH